jgi:hypothetical protein
MALAHITGGQYVPMVDANRLAQMIVSGVREEISLNNLMQNGRKDIIHEMRKATKDGITEQETAARLQQVFSKKKMYVSRNSIKGSGRMLCEMSRYVRYAKAISKGGTRYKHQNGRCRL